MRELYELILRYEGQLVFDEVLLPWLTDNEHYEEYLYQFEDEYPVEHEDQWEFYALSRVLDLLTLQFQPDNNADGTPSWPGPQLTVAEYCEFVRLLDLRISTPTHYHCFDCEILEAVKGKRDFQLLTTCFPAVKLNNLLIKRAGVIIEVNQGDATVASLNTATIYWAHWRKNRKYEDLSRGWGSNSQWRTDARIDIETDTKFIYNPQGKFNLSTDSPEVSTALKNYELTIAQAIEVVTNRQFITLINYEEEVSPYNFRYEEIK